MKRKLLGILLALALLLACPLSAAAAEAPVEISDAAGLRSMAEAPEGSYVLTANINMQGESWTPIAFSGKLDGAGYTIYNLSVQTVGEDHTTTVDGNHKEYETAFAGFFSTLTNAEVTDLTLLNTKVTVTTEENCFAALLAGYVENAQISGCTLSGTVELHSASVMAGVGGIAGFGTASFDDCSVTSTLIHVDEYADGKSEQFTGGVLSCGYCSINGCQVELAGYTSCHGYVHDGGLVGMHHQHDDSAGAVILYSSSNKVTGFIEFFEDNADRRAYCEAFCGENLHWTMSLDQNEQSFERREVYDYSTDLYPHNCESTAFSSEVTEADCDSWGFTTHSCADCGYSYKDEYTEPFHTPGDWEVSIPATLTESGEAIRPCILCGTVTETKTIAPHTPGDWQTAREPGYDEEGLRQRFCTDCGELMEEEYIAKLVRTENIALGSSELDLHYKDETWLSATVTPYSSHDRSVVWTSSDPTVVTVDEEGWVVAVGAGDAELICRTADGGAQATCPVHVSYSFGQWCVRIALLGFLWY